MDIQSILLTLKTWFDNYTHRFLSDDPIVQKAMDLKVEHTRRVCEGIVKIGLSLDLSDEDLCIAEISALLHDVGRFEQYRRYKTFLDYKSEDHALLSVTVIQNNQVLCTLDPSVSKDILKVIKYHNRATLSFGEEDRCLFFLKLLRDADKLDIWRMLTVYYLNAGHDRNQSIELDLPNTPQVSASVYEAIINGKPVKMSDLKTLTDFKLLQIGWVYDLNFPVTFKIVLEKGYLESIRNALPRKSAQVNEIYKRARAYVEKIVIKDL